MKKNKMMRSASALLVMVLLTTSVISGTFAKYVTQDSAYDTARVAKWGVVASVSGDLFGPTYKAADDNTITTYVDSTTITTETVTSDGKDNFVVAPGTKNEKGLTLAVTGTPEVSTRVIFDYAEDENGNKYEPSDIYLAAGTYGVMVQHTETVTEDNVGEYYVESNGTYTVATKADMTKDLYKLHDDVEATEYYPLKWKVGPFDCANVAAVKTALDGLLKDGTNDKTFKPNAANTLSATVTWEWAYGTAFNTATDTENITTEDKMDTILGNMIAEQKGAADYEVVCKSDKTYVAVTYAEEAAATDSANNVINVYADSAKTTKIACLTVAFNARLTVEQVD